MINTKLSPLDIVFFRGRGEPVSNLISWFEREIVGNGDWTHVGLLINSEVCNLGLEKGRWYVFESTMSRFTDIPDEISHKGKFGVQIRDFEKLIDKYIGGMAIGKLINNPYEQDLTSIGKKRFRKKFTKILKSYLSIGYDDNLISLLSVPIKCCRPIRDTFINTRGRYFCSELVGCIYQDLGMLKDRNPSDMFPINFTDKDIISSIIVIKSGDKEEDK